MKKDQLYAFQILDKKSSINQKIYKSIYEYFCFYPFEDELEVDKLVILSEALLKDICETIQHFNDIVCDYSADSQNRQGVNNALLIENFEDKFFDELSNNSELYKNDLFIGFITKLIRNKKETITSLKTEIKGVLDHFEKILFYKVKKYDIDKFEKMSLINQANYLKEFNTLSLQVNDPELLNINQNYINLLDSLKNHFSHHIQASEILSKFNQNDKDEKLTLKDILTDDFIDYEELIYDIIKSDSVGYIDKDKNWCVIFKKAFLLFDALVKCKIIKYNISKYGIFLESNFKPIKKRSFQKVPLKIDEEEEVERLKTIFENFKRTISKA